MGSHHTLADHTLGYEQDTHCMMSSNYNNPHLGEPHLHTYKGWHSPPLAYTITTVGPHFESEFSQWPEPWLSCDDRGSGRTIHNHFTIETTVIILKMNFIFGDISCSIGWWVPFQCDRRLVCVHICSQISNWVWSEICRNILSSQYWYHNYAHITH